MSKKTKQKRHLKHHEEESQLKTRVESSLINKNIPEKYSSRLFWILIAISLLTGVYYIIQSHGKNGYFGFPLDDPWIHLTFAKNLIKYGSFSYFKNEIVTSGSTSPMYTILLSILYLISKNEYIISYLLGISFSVLSVIVFYKIVNIHFSTQKIFALLVVLVLALQPKLNLISVAGMETTMFIFLVVGSFYFYKTSNKILLGLFLGLTIWCRPDGFVLWLAILIDYFIFQKSLNTNEYKNNFKIFEKREFLISLGIGTVIVFLYFIFNYTLSDSILPNTYRAKLEYYQNNLRENFLKTDVLDYFTSSEFIAIVFPFLIASIVIVIKTFKRKYDQFLVYLLFVFGLISIYYFLLPFAHRFGRYLIPVIPFYILVSAYGLIQISEFLISKSKSPLLSNLIFVLFFGSTLVFSVTNINKNSEEYTELCRYHRDRHVAAGLWINKNTPDSSIIATHDIGAIGYYGDRKLIDIVGLVTPELIQHLNDKNFSAFIQKYFSKNKVTHIAALKNWFEIVNDNPLYVPINQFEIMEIYKFKPEQTHIQSREVSYINDQAIQLVQRNDLANAIRYLQQSLSLDQASSRTNFLIGAVYEMAKDNSLAENFLQKSLNIFPDYLDANFALARVYYKTERIEESKKHFERCIQINSNYQPAIEMLEKINSSIIN